MKKGGIFLVLLSSVLLFSSAVSAESLPENHAVNGGVTIIPIDIKQKPAAFYQNKKIAISKSPVANQWLLIVGIPLDSKQAIQTIDLREPVKAKVPFHISQKAYTTQSLTIKNKRKVDPYAKDRPRIEQEQARLKSIFAGYSDASPFAQAFIAPSHGRISSLFGLRRIYNQQPRAPHSGLDIASAAGTPVHAVSKGRVVEADNYFFTGNTVIIDHGQGVFSLYAHLKDFKAKKGQEIKQAEVIGIVGMTGRVTGPHLHWSMVMNGTLVDPLLFVPLKQITAK